MIQKHRISTNIGVDQKITVELKQDFDVLEILSLKFSQKEIYTSMCSDYGVVCGRVTANNGFGLGNVRVSIFVPLTIEDEEDPVISTLYPYKEVTDKNENNYRYNLLPSRQQHSGHANTGTFPDQSDILTREEVLEVYEKYYKYTVKTNSAGDFMIWGVPIGAQTIHMDADLSDVGCFSLRPYDFIRQGIGVDGFKNKYSFKASEDLNSLPQIISIDKVIQVYPFWGNESLCEIGITRTDFDLTEKGVNIQPKAYVIGGIFTDNGKNSINKNCTPRKKMGRKCDLVAKSGTIEAIRFMHIKDEENRPYLEYVDLNEDIPDDGGFVLPLEMNMDYVITNEFGENEITNDTNKGIPTSACYRLRINLNDSGVSRARVNADYLIPNIREYQSGGTIDNRSYYFGTEWSGYPSNAISTNSDYGILCNEGGQFYPRDYFYRFTYNKVYTVSSLQSSFVKNGFFGKNQYLGLKELAPAEEEDCADNVTPPVNFGTKNYTFNLLIADFLLLLDYVIKFLYLSFLNFLIKEVLGPISEIIVDLGGGRDARNAVTKLQIATFTKLSLINYPECEECDSEFNQTTNQETPVPPYCSVGELSILGANGLSNKIVSSESYFGSVTCNSTNLISDRAYFISNQTSYILFDPISYQYISLDSLSYFEEIDGGLVFVDGAGAFTSNETTYDGIQIFDIASYDPNAIQPTESGCDLYDTIYDDSLITGYYVPSGTAGASNTMYGSKDGRKWLGTLPPGVNPISTSISTQYKNKITEPGYSTRKTDSRDLGQEYYNEAMVEKLPTSLRSEFKNGVFYMVLGTQSQGRLTGILQEYYRRKRVGKMFCGGIVNYAFIDNWLSGSLYFFQFKAKKVNRGVEGIIKYCRNVARFVEGPNRFYYRSAYTTNGTTFSFGGKNTLGTPTTFVDLGPRDEFIKEICIDKNLDPNCSVSRSIGPTSFKEFGELMGLAINYRMDVSGAKFGLDNFFDNFGSFTLKGYEQVLDGDILQLISINSEAGIEEFDLQNPKYLGYSFQVLDPELYPQVFKKGYTGGNTGYWGALPVTMELDEDGERVRSCLNEPGRLGWDSNTLGSSQKVPFYLWDKKGTGFGGTNEITSDNQSWDYFTQIKTENGNLQPLQGMTYGYTATGSFSDTSDPYLLLPITNNFSGLTITGLNVTELVEFDIISTTDDHSTYNKEYPGFTYLFANSVTNPTTGTLYTRVGNAGNNGTTGWQIVSWNSGIDFILHERQDYYGSNTKQILSTPFQFYFGLKAGKTGLDKFIDQYGPKGAFNLLECDTTLPPLPTSTFTPTPTPTNTPTPTPTGLPPTASFSTSTITAARTNGIAGTTTETSGTTITVINGTVTIKLKTWVTTGYRADTTIDVNGSSISPDFAGQGATPLSGTGDGNASFTTFTLPIGVYTVTNWTVSAISDGSLTVAQAKLEQV